MNLEKVRSLVKRSRSAARGVTLVEVLIVVAIMAVIAGGATLLAIPMYKKSRIEAAAVGCSAVKAAAELHQTFEGSEGACPTVKDLVASKKIDATKTDDPWGKPYKIECEEGSIRVRSAGNDRQEGTPDDVLSGFKAEDVKRVANL